MVRLSSLLGLRRRTVGTVSQGTSSAIFSSGPLQNTANSSVVPTEFAAEPTTKMKSSKANFVTWTFRLPLTRYLIFFLKFWTSFLSNWIVLLNKPLLHWNATVIMRFPAKENAGCPKAPRDSPSKKDGILHLPRWVSLGTPLTLPHSLYRRAYVYVTTKFSRIDRLPNLLSNCALLARDARRIR